MKFELFVALRYLKAKRKHAFISLISFISTAGVAVGVMALIVVIAVMAGFENHLRSKILGINAHLLVRSYEGAFSRAEEVRRAIEAVKVPPSSGLSYLIDRLRGLEATPRVVAATPIVYIQALLSSARGVSGVSIRGIDPDSVREVVTFGKILEGMGVDGFRGYDGQGPIPIIIGKELAAALAVSAGDTIRIVLPSGNLTPMGMIPKIRSVKVQGIQSIGMYDYDMSLAFVPISAAQKLLGIGSKVHGFEVKVSDIYAADRIARAVRQALGYPFWVMDWQQMSRNLFAALKLEKFAMFVVLTLIVLVAAFNIVSTLIMLVMEKKQDIAILKALGATDGQILRIFMLNGFMIGLMGTVIGTLGGLGLCHVLKRYKFIKIPKEVYYTDTIPILLYTSDLVIIALSAVIICFLATIYPARQAAKLNPSESLRNG